MIDGPATTSESPGEGREPESADAQSHWAWVPRGNNAKWYQYFGFPNRNNPGGHLATSLSFFLFSFHFFFFRYTEKPKMRKITCRTSSGDFIEQLKSLASHSN
jgi:hypothetical protein